jgi:nucleoid-associated protein YgaU
MTSDAKIGLLLGLVFIFVIAFVINGLPRFRSTSNGSELTTNMVSSQNDSLGIGDREREVQNLIDWPEQIVDRQPETVQAPLEDDEDIRFKIKLPESISYTPIMETAEESERAPAQPIDPSSTESITPAVVASVEPPAPQPPTDETIEIKRPRPARPVSPKIYVVSDGDNLAKIAMKLYGAEEGNRRANIMRVFEANRGLLASPDEIRIGQKLVIPPPLGASRTDRSKTERSLSSSLFEKAESIGRKLLQGDKPKTTSSRQYVVQAGDSLWQIAVAQLGDGSRYKEIAKLNADVLEDENSLDVGTTLKMPAR